MKIPVSLQSAGPLDVAEFAHIMTGNHGDPTGVRHAENFQTVAVLRRSIFSNSAKTSPDVIVCIRGYGFTQEGLRVD